MQYRHPCPPLRPEKYDQESPASDRYLLEVRSANQGVLLGGSIIHGPIEAEGGLANTRRENRYPGMRNRPKSAAAAHNAG